MPASHPVYASEATSRFFPTPVQIAARASGILLLGLGVLGVVSGPLGYHAGVADRLLHLAFGVLGLMLARTAAAARAYFVAGSVAFLASTALQNALLHDHGVSRWVDLPLAVAMMALAATLGRGRKPGRPPPRGVG